MRTGLFVLVGFLLLAASLILGKLFSSQFPGALWTAVVSFAIVWLLIAGTNLWVGVAKAGYGVGDGAADLPADLRGTGGCGPVPPVAVCVERFRCTSS
jgi:hypothetical protein